LKKRTANITHIHM